MLQAGSKERKLDDVTKLLNDLKMPIALVSTPINLDAEKKLFFASDTYNPHFKYKKLSNNNSKILKELDRVERITDVDPRISDFYIKLIDSKKESNDLYNAIGDNLQFTKLGLKKYRAPSPVLFRNACRVMRGNVAKYKLYEPKKGEKANVDFEQAVKLIKAEFDKYGLDDWTVDSSINIAKNGLKTAIKRKAVIIDGNIMVKPSTLRKNVVHEMTHVLRSVNGMESGFEALSKPTLAYYLDVEEGLATLNVENAGLLKFSDLKIQAAKVWAVYIGRELSFRELYNSALAFLTREEAWKLVYRVKRGLSDTEMPGINAKDVVYFRGFRRVRKRYEEDPKFIQKLYAGKIGFTQVKWVDEGLIKKPKLLPKI